MTKESKHHYDRRAKNLLQSGRYCTFIVGSILYIRKTGHHIDSNGGIVDMLDLLNQL